MNRTSVLHEAKSLYTRKMHCVINIIAAIIEPALATLDSLMSIHASATGLDLARLLSGVVKRVGKDKGEKISSRD